MKSDICVHESDFWVDLFIAFKFDVKSPGCLALPTINLIVSIPLNLHVYLHTLIFFIVYSMLIVVCVY